MSEKNLAYLISVFKQSEFVNFFKRWFKLNRWTATAFILISAGATSFIVYNRGQITTLLNEGDKLRRQKQQRINELKILEAELINLQNGNRITTIASTQLGMIHSTKAPKDIK